MTTFSSFSKHPAGRFVTWRQRRSVTSAHSPAWQVERIRYDKENVQGGGSDPDMPLIMVAQRSIELDEAQHAYTVAVEAAEHAIGILPDWRKQFVLTSRYVDTPALTWPQIAEALGLSLRQTYRMKNNAINDICKMTDGRVLAAVS